MIQLTSEEADLLLWLGKEEYSQYGECYGKTLDSLIEKGLARVHEDGGTRGTFIAKGRGKMYNSVSLTEAGRAAIEAAQDLGGRR
jgi:hypothetical protein